MDGSLNDGTAKVEADEVPSHDIAPGPSGHDPEARVRERAYRIWEEEGRPEGHEERHWHLARELLSIEDSSDAGLLAVDAGMGVASTGEPLAPLDGAADLPGLSDQGDRQPVPQAPEKAARRGRRSA